MASTSRHREFLDFADYLKIYQASGFGWMKVIDDIFAVVPGAKLHLWDFSSFRTVESDVFRTMLGFDPARLEEPEGPGARIPFRDCHHRHRDVEQGAQPRGNEKLIKPIARNLPKGEGRAGFDPLPPETKDVLRAQYKVDLSAILAKYPAINFIGG